MVLVKEETMKPRTRTLAAIGATVVTAGLVIGLSFAGSSAAARTNQTTPTTVSMPMDQMPEMGSMMTGDSNGMAAVMGSADMSSMHSAMHSTMHSTMNSAMHDAHHAGTGS
jgi:hypothetical protein